LMILDPMHPVNRLAHEFAEHPHGSKPGKTRRAGSVSDRRRRAGPRGAGGGERSEHTPAERTPRQRPENVNACGASSSGRSRSRLACGVV
jgi:hypothetical protein